MSVKGYKVFNPDWTCRGFQYAVGETFRHEGEIDVCESGFHFCEKVADCFNYYTFDSNNKVAEIEAVGNVKTEGDKSVTDEITIVRELSWDEVLNLANEGKNCTGHHNTGNFNLGDRNSGDFNSGNRNSGDFNSGDWNACDYSSGFFNSVSPPVYAFNKPLNISRSDFLKCDGIIILNRHYLNNIWVDSVNMTAEEKQNHPEYKCTGGYLKTVDFRTACGMMWDRLTSEEKQKVREIPNFDASVFEEITGIDVTDGGD